MVSPQHHFGPNHQPTSTGTVATKPRKNGIFDNVDVMKRSLLFKCLRVARSHRENTAIPSTEGLSEGHCHNPLQNNGLENGYSRTTVPRLRHPRLRLRQN